MRLLCPAKINLHLRVGPLRGDGFHPLLSWFCTAGLFDTLTLEQAAFSAAPSEQPHIALTCDQADLPLDRRNLVVKVAEAFAEDLRKIHDAQVSPVHAHLQKRIPAGAGLGGGSSDGARTLAGLNSLWNIGRTANELSAFAARFGSDLPFFFFGPSSVCKGRGEIVVPIARPAARWVVLILPPIAMPTADVYRRFDAMKLGRDTDVQVEPDWHEWAALQARPLLDRLVNDLEPPAFAISSPLATLRGDVEKLLDRPVRMSGSGSSLFTLCDSADEAQWTRRRIEQTQPVRVETVELSPDFADDHNANR
jgi:4-diphosphocytidyl-2-C-methyl-D-erythritol kinase